MLTVDQEKWYHSNQYAAEPACEHCEGIVRHEPWCITANRSVAYAYQAIVNPDKLSLQDQLTLHALGVAWAADACDRKCATH